LRRVLFCCLLLISACLLFAVVAIVKNRTHHTDQRGITFNISPDGHQIIFTGYGAGKRDLYRLSLDTRHVVRISDSSDYESDPSYLPDGRHIVFSAAKEVSGPITSLFARWMGAVRGSLPRIYLLKTCSPRSLLTQNVSPSLAPPGIAPIVWEDGPGTNGTSGR
jgi:hypothetical protein